MVQLLLSLGASLSLTDDDGDTALHYSAFGWVGLYICFQKLKFDIWKNNQIPLTCFVFRNQPEIMDLLLKAGADRNAINKGSCTALHVAVNKQHVHCVRVLLRWKCNVNIQVWEIATLLFHLKQMKSKQILAITLIIIFFIFRTHMEIQSFTMQ